MTDDLIDADSIEAADEKFVMRPWPHPAGEPVIIAKAKGCTIWDVHGKEYLDLTAGYFVNNAGHCHPKIIEAATKQLHTVLQVSGKHGTVASVRLAEKLVNLVLGRFYADTAALRRALVDHGFLDRDHGEYWRSGGHVQL